MNGFVRRWITAMPLAMAMAVLLAPGPAGALVAQVPLTGNSEVPPNLMFTFDQSNSMELECVPDLLCNGGYGYVMAVPVYSTTLRSLSSIASYGSNSIFGMKMRSAINPLYYNPAVRYLPWLKADGTRWPSYPATKAPVDPRVPTGASFNLTVPQTVKANWCNSVLARLVDCYFPTPYLTDQTFLIAQYYVLAPNASGAALSDYRLKLIQDGEYFPRYPGRTDCAGPQACTYAEEIQNFSNWFTYARSRLFVAIGGTSEAFSAVPPSYRVGFGAINSAGKVDGIQGKTVVRGVRPFSGSDRQDFYDWIQGMKVTGTTPLRRAMDDVGQYFSRKDSRSPWADNPAVGQPPSQHLSCRKAFHILMTDGVWGDDAVPTAGANANVDGVDGPTIRHADGSTTYTYRAGPPYKDGNAATLADVAMYYWRSDLRDDLANNVPTTASDPAFWQHMVNYTIAFGVNGRLRNPEDLPALAAGTASWGTPASNAELDNVDDLWHAAINSRGLSRSATNATEYGAAIRSIVEDISARTVSQAGVAVSSRSYTSSTREYVPSYNTSDWSGELEAIALADGTSAWRASERLPTAASRNLFTFDDTIAHGVPFKAADVASAGMSSLLESTNPSGLIGYLRGDRTGEGTTYRRRTKLLGDIVNSTPALVKDLFDGQYDFLSSSTPGQSSYLRFLDNKKSRAAQIFAGANDGMLHAFNADSGVETFGFVPRAVLGNLKQLADPAYSHRYFVDGPVMEADIYDDTATRWRNLVVGSGGGGAKNLFAINVPVSTTLSQGKLVSLTDAQSAPGASDILWEVNGGQPGFQELGNVLQRPEAGILRSGKWAVITGNGYDSPGGRAQLFVIDALNGALIKTIDTGVGSSLQPNGLGGVAVALDDAKRIVAAYGGDLRGNMWKFDLSSSDPSAWSASFSGKPLFSAVNDAGGQEPITAAPALLQHPSGGLMVLAGSGKLFEAGDGADAGARSLYGVWDKQKTGAKVDADNDRLADNTSLVTQTIASLSGAGGSPTFYAVSGNSVDYGAHSSKRGWTIRLGIEAGQRLIHAPQIESGRVIFDTLVPGLSPNGCTAVLAHGFRFVLDPLTGAPSKENPTFDTNGDGSYNALDNVTVGVVRVSTVGRGTIVRLPGSQQIRMEAGSPSASSDSRKVNLGKSAIWRQWRQIATPPAF